MQNSKAVGYFVCWENLRDRIALRAVWRLMIQCSHTSLQREHGVEQPVKERKEVSYRPSTAVPGNGISPNTETPPGLYWHSRKGARRALRAH